MQQAQWFLDINLSELDDAFEQLYQRMKSGRGSEGSIRKQAKELRLQYAAMFEVPDDYPLPPRVEYWKKYFYGEFGTAFEDEITEERKKQKQAFESLMDLEQ